MLHKHFIMGSALVLGAVSTGILSGCHPGLRHHFCHGSPEKLANRITAKIKKELDMTQAQQVELDRIKKEILAKLDENKDSRKQQFDAILAEALKDTIDQDALNRLIEEQHQRMEGMRPFLISKYAEFRAMLAPEQKKKMAEKVKKFHEKMSR
jgi:Spy/CpxP family protein refolding chaperone